MKKLIFIFLLFTGIVCTQPLNADFFGIEDRATFDNVITWVSFSNNVAVDIENQTVAWNVVMYKENFTDPDGTIHFQILINRQVKMDFPSQALPLRNLKSKMKDESAIVLGLTYNGQEQ